jgi:hypothetical protein
VDGHKQLPCHDELPRPFIHGATPGVIPLRQLTQDIGVSLDGLARASKELDGLLGIWSQYPHEIDDVREPSHGIWCVYGRTVSPFRGHTPDMPTVITDQPSASDVDRPRIRWHRCQELDDVDDELPFHSSSLSESIDGYDEFPRAGDTTCSEGATHDVPIYGVLYHFRLSAVEIDAHR